MPIVKDKVRTRETLASKIAGQKSRKRAFIRDLRGRFSSVEVRGATEQIAARARGIARRSKARAALTQKVTHAARTQKGRRLRR